MTDPIRPATQPPDIPDEVRRRLWRVYAFLLTLAAQRETGSLVELAGPTLSSPDIGLMGCAVYRGLGPALEEALDVSEEQEEHAVSDQGESTGVGERPPPYRRDRCEC